MAHETKLVSLPADAELNDVRKELLLIAEEIRRLGAGQQAERLEAVEKALRPPRFRGVLRTVAQPHTWLSRKYAMWMAEQIMTAADLIHELLHDAEIVGSLKTIDRARTWLNEMELWKK